MKKFLFFIFLAATLTACNKNSYTIEGTVDKGEENSTVYLVKLVEGAGVVPIDSTTLVKGQFSFKGVQDTAAVRFIFYHNSEGVLKNCMIILEGGKIKVHFGEETAVEGTPANVAVRKYYEDMKFISSKYNELQTRIMADSAMEKAHQDSLVNGMMTAMELDVKAAVMNHLLHNLDNPLGAYLLKTMYTNLDAKAIMPLFDKVPPIYRDKELEAASKYVSVAYERSMADEKTAAGKMYADFSMNDAQGTSVKFSQCIGMNKITIVHFWAGWCKPCLKELPTLLEIYGRYQKRGVGFVGISLDSDGKVWRDAVTSNSLPGWQLSDLQGANNAAAQLYGIVYIPSMMIVGENGIILEKNVKLDKLEEKLKLYTGATR